MACMSYNYSKKESFCEREIEERAREEEKHQSSHVNVNNSLPVFLFISFRSVDVLVIKKCNGKCNRKFTYVNYSKKENNKKFAF